MISFQNSKTTKHAMENWPEILPAFLRVDCERMRSRRSSAAVPSHHKETRRFWRQLVRPAHRRGQVKITTTSVPTDLAQPFWVYRDLGGRSSITSISSHDKRDVGIRFECRVIR